MDIVFTKELVKCTTGLDIHIIRNDPSEMLPLLGESIKGVIRLSEYEKMIHHLFRSMRVGTIYEVSAVLGVCYTAFIDNDGNFILIGPCIEESLSSRAAQHFLQDTHYAVWAVQSFIEYCRQLPVVPHQKRHQIASLLAKKFLGTSSPLPFQRLNFNLSQDEQNRLMLVDNYEEISKIRMVEKRQEELIALTEAVKQGNLSLAYSFLNVLNADFDSDEFGHDTIRAVQNSCIVLNARFQKAMEELGIHPYSLEKVSAEVFSQIDKMKNTKDGSKYMAEMIRMYCRLSQENSFSALSPFSKQVVTYVKNHLSDNVTVKSTAAALVMNPDYLSHRFHQETGQTFINFVNQERVEQAAVLLKNTNMLIKQIAVSVGFNNTSYFAKQFLHFKGTSPSSFRSEAKL